MRNTFLALITIFMYSNSSSQVTVVEDSIPSGKNFKNASFRLWLQQDTGFVRGVVVLMPGSNDGGIDWVMDSSPPVALLDLREEDGYIGDFKLRENHAYKDWKESYYPTAWLPGQGFAKAWLSLINGDCTENDAIDEP